MEENQGEEKMKVYTGISKTGQRVEADDKPGSTQGQQTSNIVRFKMLSGFGEFIINLGWVIMFGGTIVFIFGLINWGTARITGGILGAIAGLFFVIYGQIIACFVSIEQNTYETNQAIKSFVEKVPKNS